MDNILSVEVKNPYTVMREIMEKVRLRRLELDLTQETLSEKSGVNISTYRRFERTGEISFRGLLQIAFAMDMLSDFDSVFAMRQYRTLEDVERENEGIRRKRGRR